MKVSSVGRSPALWSASNYCQGRDNNRAIITPKKSRRNGEGLTRTTIEQFMSLHNIPPRGNTMNKHGPGPKSPGKTAVQRPPSRLDKPVRARDTHNSKA